MSFFWQPGQTHSQTQARSCVLDAVNLAVRSNKCVFGVFPTSAPKDFLSLMGQLHVPCRRACSCLLGSAGHTKFLYASWGLPVCFSDCSHVSTDSFGESLDAIWRQLSAWLAQYLVDNASDSWMLSPPRLMREQPLAHKQAPGKTWLVNPFLAIVNVELQRSTSSSLWRTSSRKIDEPIVASGQEVPAGSRLLHVSPEGGDLSWCSFCASTRPSLSSWRRLCCWTIPSRPCTSTRSSSRTLGTH